MRFADLLLRSASVHFGFSDVASIVLIYSLKVVIGGGNVMGCGKVMVLLVAMGAKRHQIGAFLWTEGLPG